MPPKDKIVVQAAEISRVKGVAELRSESCAAQASHVHHAGQRIGAIEHAVGAAKHFNLVNAGGEDAAKIDGAADLIERNAIRSTLLNLLSPPRIKSDSLIPRWPFSRTCTPGTGRSGSSTSGLY